MTGELCYNKKHQGIHESLVFSTKKLKGEGFMERVFYSDERSVVKTEKGAVKGYFCDGVYTFKGIPYAKAKRFMDPEPVESWEGEFDATSYGYVCPLMAPEKPSGELLVPHRYWMSSEDCQNLNVWTPGLDDGKRPVLVWLHGGGFVSGSAMEQDAYEGGNMSRMGDCVVVSVNHRLNVLGYFDLSPFGEKYRDSGNCGGNDIIAALKWVKDNIAAFGGDPGNVTLFGQSGGGCKITTLLQTPAADGLYHKGIIMSGVVPAQMMGSEEGDSTPFVMAMLEELGLTVDEVEKLETLSYQLLADAYLKVGPVLQQEGKYAGGVPKANAFYLGDPLRVGFREETKQVPLMVGSVFGEFDFAPLSYDKRTLTKEEGIAIAKKRLGEKTVEKALPMFEKAYSWRNPVDMVSLDVIFRPASMAYIGKRAKAGAAPIYSYLFDMDFPIQNGKCAWHCSDIPYVFHNIDMVPAVNVTGVSERLQHQIFESVMAFAKTGNPGHDDIPVWDPSAADEEKIMFFGKEVHQEINADHELIPAIAPAAMGAFMKLMAQMDIKH